MPGVDPGVDPASRRPPPLVVIGGGLVGPVVATYLARRFGDVTLLERRGPDELSDSIGRSVNVVLSARGWRVLRDLALEDSVRAVSLPLRGRLEHSRHGELVSQPYGRRGEQIWCVERSRLNRLLMDAARAVPGVRLRYGVRVQAVQPDTATVVVEGSTGPRRLACSRVIGCDGAFSQVRKALAGLGAHLEERTLELGYKEIRIPPDAAGRWRLPHQVFHIWPRDGVLFSAFPNPAGDFTGSIFLPLHGEGISFDTVRTGRDAAALFERLFPDIAGEIPDVAAQYERRPPNTIVTTRTDRWVWRDKVALVGDSAHAVAPFMGQGMNCGFEDARTLDECLAAAGDREPDWAAAFARYQQLRKPNADAIAEISLRHYHHLATPSTTTDSGEVLRTRVAERLYDACPEHVPLYERCAFSEEPYAEAWRRHLVTELLLDDLLIDPGGRALLRLPSADFVDAVRNTPNLS